MQFYDYRGWLVPEDDVELWANVLAEGIENWLEQLNEPEETL